MRSLSKPLRGTLNISNNSKLSNSLEQLTTRKTRTTNNSDRCHEYDRYSQSRNLRFIARTYESLNNTESAIQSWTASRDLAISINYEPFQTSAQQAIDRLCSKSRMTSQQKGFIGFCIGIAIAFLVWKLRN